MIRDFALLAARLTIGVSMAAHGAQKAFGMFDGPGPEKAAGLMHSLGFRPGETYASLAAWNEIGSGLAIAAGAGGPLAPAILISNMIVAGASVHLKNGYFAQNGGVEVAVLYGTAALTFAAGGYGKWSVDSMLGLDEKLNSHLLLGVSMAGAVAAAIVVLNNRDMSPESPATPTFQGTNSPLEKVEPA
jgi:putative oxidoreductase